MLLSAYISRFLKTPTNADLPDFVLSALRFCPSFHFLKKPNSNPPPFSYSRLFVLCPNLSLPENKTHQQSIFLLFASSLHFVFEPRFSTCSKTQQQISLLNSLRPSISAQISRNPNNNLPPRFPPRFPLAQKPNNNNLPPQLSPPLLFNCAQISHFLQKPNNNKLLMDTNPNGTRTRVSTFACTSGYH